MAVKVLDAAAAALKFTQRAAGAAQDYANGVRGAGPAWQQNTAAAAENFAAGVQTAIQNGSFRRGVEKAGSAKYEQRAATVGAQRFPQGVREAGPTWEQNTQPFLQTIASLNLPPRRPKGDPGNFSRVEAVGQALRAKKLGR